MPGDRTEYPSRRFPTTSWSTISLAAQSSGDCAAALAELCTTYWYPVYAFIRGKGYPKEEAEDLCQAFFLRILEHGTLAGAQRERGKFRSFLLASVTNFLANEWDRSQAQKRGGGTPMLSFDFQAGDAQFHGEPRHDLTPEARFEQCWALALLNLVLERLRQEQTGPSQVAQFDRLQIFLTGDQERGAYDRLAVELDSTPAAIRIAVHRLRRRYAELIREEIAAVVADPEEVEGEIRFLLAALARA